MKQTLFVGFKKTICHKIPYNRTGKNDDNKLFTPKPTKTISKLANKLEHKQNLKNNELNEMHSKIEKTTLDIKTEPESYEDQNLESNQMNFNTDKEKTEKVSQPKRKIPKTVKNLQAWNGEGAYWKETSNKRKIYKKKSINSRNQGNTEIDSSVMKTRPEPKSRKNPNKIVPEKGRPKEPISESEKSKNQERRNIRPKAFSCKFCAEIFRGQPVALLAA